jgi:hypothetical protein
MLSAQHSDSLVDFHIYTNEDVIPSSKASNVYFHHITARQLAETVKSILGTVCERSVENVTSNFQEGAKINDLKPMYGALFKEQLQSYSHWYNSTIATALTAFID